MTANTLTDLIPDLYASLDVVSRELVGLIPAVSRDSGAERAAKDQVVRSFVTPSNTTSDIVPAQDPSFTGEQTIGNKQITISKVKKAEIKWEGEETRGIESGAGYNPILQDQLVQAMRALVNEVEADLGGEFAKASNAVNPAGTNLFDGDNYLDASAAIRELNKNGAPLQDRQMVLSNVAAYRFRGNSTYASANTSGDTSMLRQGVLLDQFGFQIRESNFISQGTAGDAASATTDNAGYAVGDTVITLASAGTGEIKDGDTISFAGDDNLYVVESGDADVSNGGTITLAAPGLKQAIAASTTAITVANVGAAQERNMAFSRNAIHLITRAPALPMGGDMASDRMVIQDPRSGLAFDVAMYRMYYAMKIEVSLAWGYQVIKPEHLVLLLD